LLEVAAVGCDLSGDDDLLFGDGGLSVVGGDEGAAETFSTRRLSSAISIGAALVADFEQGTQMERGPGA
jgi:hypothetical protein